MVVAELPNGAPLPGGPGNGAFTWRRSVLARSAPRLRARSTVAASSSVPRLAAMLLRLPPLPVPPDNAQAIIGGGSRWR